MSKGWICLHRQIWDSDIWNSNETFTRRCAWIDLLLLANHDEETFNLGNEIVTVERGSILTSKRKLAKRWGWSTKKVSAFLDELDRKHMGKHYCTHKRTVITVENYNKFQDIGNTKETKTGRKRKTNNKLNNIESTGYRRTESGLDKAWGE